MAAEASSEFDAFLDFFLIGTQVRVDCRNDDGTFSLSVRHDPPPRVPAPPQTLLRPDKSRLCPARSKVTPAGHTEPVVHIIWGET